MDVHERSSRCNRGELSTPDETVYNRAVPPPPTTTSVRSTSWSGGLYTASDSKCKCACFVIHSSHSACVGSQSCVYV